MSKYPASTRVTAGKLRPGDTVLIRAGAQDLQYLDGQQGVPWADRLTLEPGQYELLSVTSDLEYSGRKAVRYYTLTFYAGAVRCSSVQRWNLVTG